MYIKFIRSDREKDVQNSISKLQYTLGISCIRLCTFSGQSKKQGFVEKAYKNVLFPQCLL